MRPNAWRSECIHRTQTGNDDFDFIGFASTHGARGATRPAWQSVFARHNFVLCLNPGVFENGRVDELLRPRMDPVLAKIIFVFGYVIANFVIRTPYIKAHHRLPIRANRKTRTDTSLLLAVSLGGFGIPLLYVFSPLFSFADYSIPLWVGVMGVIVLLLANWLFWKSHKDLGDSWSPTLEIRENHKLVMAGIYRRIRHPMYLSIWLLVLAQAMILPNYVAGFTGLLAFGSLYFQRVAREERMMKEEFGSEYEHYLQRTGRLLPKL